MADIAWELEHTVEAGASRAFVWSFWTNVANWDDPPARFVLDGPFAAGTRGVTTIPSQPAREWTIAAVQPQESFTIEMALEGATLSFRWGFEPVSADRTELTQRIVLSGENSAAHVESVRAGFASTLAPGMKRIAGLIEAAADVKMDHVGKSYLIDYGQLAIEVTYLSPDKLRWRQVKGPEAGTSAEETYGFSAVRPGVGFYWWQEKDTSIVTQVVDFEKGRIYTTWASPEKKLAAFEGAIKPKE